MDNCLQRLSSPHQLSESGFLLSRHHMSLLVHDQQSRFLTPRGLFFICHNSYVSEPLLPQPREYSNLLAVFLAHCRVIRNSLADHPLTRLAIVTLAKEFH